MSSRQPETRSASKLFACWSGFMLSTYGIFNFTPCCEGSSNYSIQINCEQFDFFCKSKNKLLQNLQQFTVHGSLTPRLAYLTKDYRYITSHVRPRPTQSTRLTLRPHGNIHGHVFCYLNRRSVYGTVY